MAIYQNDLIRIEVEESEIPWLKIFTQHPYKELSDAPAEVKAELWRVLERIEIEMRAFYNPDKINIASFGNYVPHLHVHIMARFRNDSYFPEPMWGTKQREGSWELKDFDRFCETLCAKL